MKVRRAAALAHRAAEIGWATVLARRPIRRGPRHGLDREVIVSLTSYPPRFPTLHLTLRSLLNQSVSPDRLILWIAEGDAVHLPPSVRDLEAIGVEIRLCDDLRSFKKIVPALKQFPESYIVTADDDVFYKRSWLKSLIAAAVPSTGDIVAHTVRRTVYTAKRLAPIEQWNMNAVDGATQVASDDLFPTGVAGVLYPPHSLHPDVVDKQLFLSLCPTCDDSWLAWMARRQGTLVRRSNTPRWTRFIAWQGTNQSALSKDNFGVEDGQQKQDQIHATMAEHFGPLNALKDAS